MKSGLFMLKHLMMIDYNGTNPFKFFKTMHLTYICIMIENRLDFDKHDVYAFLPVVS